MTDAALSRLLNDFAGQGNATELYEQVFCAGWREQFNEKDAARDLTAISHIQNDDAMAFALGRHQKNHSDYWLNIYFKEKSMALSDSLPLLENCGFHIFSESCFHINGQNQHIELSHFLLNPAFGIDKTYLDDPKQQEALLDLLYQVFHHHIENDRFNALVISAGLSVRETELIRALAHFLKQAALPFDLNTIANSLLAHRDICRLLIALFYARLHPQRHDDAAAEGYLKDIHQALKNVDKLEEDTILNAFLTLINAILRTNFWQVDEAGQAKETISFKIHSSSIPFLPKPHPLYEIWVYSPRVEGTHLRGAKVARGGLRWSDRYDDFRTEVLGLVKAQMVKNSVIVPHGSKGGFVAKQLPNPADREAYAAEGLACYQLFISSLLDLTDNVIDGQLIPPANTHRRDDDDPYLVVAADKGTARFSDAANAIAKAHDFWLGDAFASGGSAGYDHKGMGITARGAWESIKRHFRHLGRDIQNEDFTVVGIGDMGGDVFGNGMLLSKHIRLVAAFNHRHIFLDPNPDATTSYNERKRLFDAVQGWDGYNPALISQGGGVFERNAKSIPLSEEVKTWLKTHRNEMTPAELIRTLLTAPVDLVYNGGIGTYIKSSAESHDAAHDKANDSVRVNGGDMHARVLGEGGNLGATQLGRIEFQLQGGRCCTDAIDNSGGVDCSDHEVNIKILLSEEVKAGRLSLEARDALLKDMTAEVAALVLKNNYQQTQILAISQLTAAEDLSTWRELMSYLSEHAGLNPTLEFLPNPVTMREREAAALGLTIPEMAVLLSYSKMDLQTQLLESHIPDDTLFEEVLTQYFPAALQKGFPQPIAHHYLRREIIANQLANRMINRMGADFPYRMMRDFDCKADKVVRAWWLASQLMDGEALFSDIEALDNRMDANLQMRLMRRVQKTIESISRYLLAHHSDLTENAINQADFDSLRAKLNSLVTAEEHPAIAAMEQTLQSSSDALTAENIALFARMSFIGHLPVIIDLATQTQTAQDISAKSFFKTWHALDMDALLACIDSLPRQNRWQNQAALAIHTAFIHIHLTLTEKTLTAPDGVLLDTVCRSIEQFKSYPALDFAMLYALSRQLQRLIA